MDRMSKQIKNLSRDIEIIEKEHSGILELDMLYLGGLWLYIVMK